MSIKQVVINTIPHLCFLFLLSKGLLNALKVEGDLTFRTISLVRAPEVGRLCRPVSTNEGKGTSGIIGRAKRVLIIAVSWLVQALFSSA